MGWLTNTLFHVCVVFCSHHGAPVAAQGYVSAEGDLDALLDLGVEGGRALRWAGPSIVPMRMHSHPPPTWSTTYATVVPTKATFGEGALRTRWPYNGKPQPGNGVFASWFQHAWAQPAAVTE